VLRVVSQRQRARLLEPESPHQGSSVIRRITATLYSIISWKYLLPGPQEVGPWAHSRD